VTNEEVTERSILKKIEERKRREISCVLYSSFINTGMFHKDEEHNRTVDLIDELQHSYGSTTSTTSTSTFELGQNTSGDFDSTAFDFDCDFERGDFWGTNSSTYFSLGEPQYSTTFTSEDKWPI
jgi:hypothetical protein